jgi:hypothetical protein
MALYGKMNEPLIPGLKSGLKRSYEPPALDDQCVNEG